MSGRAWRERDHPRWPKGSGDRSGEFRDASVAEKVYQTDRGGRVTQAEAARIMHGDDWAAKAGRRAQPAGRYGSISTGQTSQCPRCGRTVKIVGTAGKQSTHNADKGKRCPGSGEVVKPGDAVQDLVKKRSKPPSRNREIKAPEPPRVVIGKPQEVVTGAAKERMDRWIRATHERGAVEQFNIKTRREWEIENVEREIKETLGPRLEYAQQRARTEIRRQMYDAGENPNNLQDRIDWGWNDEVDRQTRHERAALQQALDYLDALRNRQPIPDQQGVRMGLGGYPRKEWTPDDLEEPISAGSFFVARPYDPERPLSIYGDRLHIDDETWHTYQALDSLEQRVPPVFHRAVATHFARKYAGASHPPGMWISGTKPLPNLDSLQSLRGQKPRGWHKGATWDDVDGVVSGGATMAVSYTSNTESSRRRLQRLDSTAGSPPDASATLHEFGHLLDRAVGEGGESASKRRLWRLIHSKVKKQGGIFLNPYFKQGGDAGPQELWADAFGAWAESDPKPRTLATGAPHVYNVGYDKAGNWITRQVTDRTIHISGMYDIPYSVAFEIEDYFERIAKEAGRRFK